LDIFLQPQLDSYAGAVQYGDPSIRDKEWLFIIPLGHCTGDDADFRYPKFEIGDPQLMSIQLFKGNYSHPIFTTCNILNFYVFGPVPTYLPANTSYVGNYYTSLATWPKFTPTNYYLNEKGTLTTTSPTSASNFSYVYDPKNPAPAYGANTLFSSTPCGPRDQAKIESRSDVLKWTSDPLAENLAVTGKITATLLVSSSANDTDFFVTLTDVYPTSNLSVNVRYGAIRMQWRINASQSNLIVPGQLYQVNIDMWSTSYIFNKGHSIRVHITSSRSPEFSVNPNNGGPLYNNNGPLIVATNTILSGPTALSYVTLPVVNIDDIPENPKIH